MRALMTAGEALKRDNVAGYDFVALSVRVESVLLMKFYMFSCVHSRLGSVFRPFLDKLATISEEFEESDTTIVVQDSKMGWAKAYKELTSFLLEVKFQNGTCQRLNLLAQDSRLSLVVLRN